MNKATLSKVSIQRRTGLETQIFGQGHLGAAQVRRILNFSSRWETYQFLKEEKAYLPYTEADLDEDSQSLDNLFAKAFK
ncbi:MAG: UPF0175 family protein [Moorea sp. SIO3C2]|nr:UPF0175 family protein [Moorena sp. SIO3C2]